MVLFTINPSPYHMDPIQMDFPTNSIAPFLVSKHTHNPQFLQSLWQRADTQNISFSTLYSVQFTLSTQLIILNDPVLLSHQHNTTVSLETCPPLFIWFSICLEYHHTYVTIQCYGFYFVKKISLFFELSWLQKITVPCLYSAGS